MSKGILRGGLLGAWVAGVSVIAWASQPGSRPLPPTRAFARDTVRDSLLVSNTVYQGWKWYHVYCFRCHGEDAIGAVLAPDLRLAIRPQGGLTHDDFFLCAWEGRLTKGMPAWKVLLDSTQIEQLYAYVKVRSTNALMAGRPHRAEDVKSN